MSYPVIKDYDSGIYAIERLVNEMERRIGIPANELRDLPEIVCVIDEYVSFIDNVKDKKQECELNEGMTNLLRRGRKAKIHMVLATQDPKVKAVGDAIGNITCRMAFKVAKYQTSVNVLNCGGAEKLPGNGAMLYQSVEHADPVYIQGAYIQAEEVEILVDRIKLVEHDLSHKFLIPIKEPECSGLPAENRLSVQAKNQNADQEFVKIALWTLEHSTISTEQIKESFAMGTRAREVIDRLCEVGLITGKNANQPRKVLPQSAEDVPEEVMAIFVSNGISVEDLQEAFLRRK